MLPVSQLSTLSNGWQLATTLLPHSPSTSIGFYLRVGSRHETDSQRGAAHFLEHMLFKGTETRDAKAIVWDIESHGGDINAFTSDDHTCYDATGPAELLPQLAEVLADIVWNSTLPEEEIDRERQVIEEEIIMYQENPGEHLDDLSSESLWSPHPLGLPITGTAQSLAGINRTELLDFYNTHYHHGSHVISVAGPHDHRAVLTIIEKLIQSSHGPASISSQPFDFKTLTNERTVIEERDIEQTHLSLSFHTGGALDGSRHTRRVLSVLLGETMSSRLFQTLREQSGLCYHIESDTTFYQDTGCLSINAGLDSRRLDEAQGRLREEVEFLRKTPPSESEVQQAIRYLCGQSRISFETSGSWRSWSADCLLTHNELRNPEDMRQHWQVITVDDVHAEAQAIFSTPRALAAITSDKSQMAL